MNDSVYDNCIAHLSIDCVIFGYEDKQLKVLIAKFKFAHGSWTLPGGYISKTESIDAAAERILQTRTGLKNIYLEQFRIFGGEKRITDSPYKDILKQQLNKFDDQRFSLEVVEWMTSRFVSIGYYALVDISQVNPQAGELDQYLEWRNVNDIPEMIHDHGQILSCALEALRENLDKKLIGFNLLPETFTIRQVQQLYETVYNRAFPINNFQKKMMDLNVLERLQKNIQVLPIQHHICSDLRKHFKTLRFIETSCIEKAKKFEGCYLPDLSRRWKFLAAGRYLQMIRK